MIIVELENSTELGLKPLRDLTEIEKNSVTSIKIDGEKMEITYFQGDEPIINITE